MERPLFSLIIPIWKTAPYLQGLWESLVCQNLEDTEIIFINDGSPDESATKIASYIQAWMDKHQKSPCPFHLIHQENAGVAIARNKGFSLAQGKYIWFIDSDDLLSADALTHLRSAVQKYPAADCILFPFIRIDEEKAKKIHQFSEINWENFTPFSLNLPVQTLQQRMEPLFMQQPAPWNKVYKKDFLLQNEGVRFAPKLWYEDLQFFANMLALKPRWLALDQPLYAYRLRLGSTMHAQIDQRNFDVHDILKNIESFYQEMNVHEPFHIGLEAIKAYHGYLAPMTRFLKLGANRAACDKLRLWMLENCPKYAANPLLSRKQKILGFLYDQNLGWLVKKFF